MTPVTGGRPLAAGRVRVGCVLNRFADRPSQHDMLAPSAPTFGDHYGSPVLLRQQVRPERSELGLSRFLQRVGHYDRSADSQGGPRGFHLGDAAGGIRRPRFRRASSLAAKRPGCTLETSAAFIERPREVTAAQTRGGRSNAGAVARYSGFAAPVCAATRKASAVLWTPSSNGVASDQKVLANLLEST